MLSSKRARVALATAVTFLTAVGFAHRYGALPDVRTVWKTPDHGAEGAKNSRGRPAVAVPPVGQDPEQHNTDWSRFAYVQYVTNSAYLCNSVMLFETLHRLGTSRADRVMMYPAVHATWSESFTKLLAFNQTQYDRVLSLDSNSILLQTIDELFLLPLCPIAMPRAYWLHSDVQALSSLLMLVQPSNAEFQRIMDEMARAGNNDYDMEILNRLYRDNALVLPHRPYALLTTEFRQGPDKHGHYLGGDDKPWDPVAPWLSMPEGMKEAQQPECWEREGMAACAERDLWNGFYQEFRDRRERVCGVKTRRGKRRVMMP
ncbi:nucleotide-diphospho-sugar transferase [Schizothecium vesticola]|uniref:Nucleotide-diphospho-sugar transferase n=1 Tax=Schizothecium vesticola TaxID=314040 RepID=A0AA40EHA4_9PEZI|nr:nucleotide-diphospho-sugar transferase [Schizothecium vesticola]